MEWIEYRNLVGSWFVISAGNQVLVYNVPVNLVIWHFMYLVQEGQNCLLSLKDLCRIWNEVK